MSKKQDDWTEILGPPIAAFVIRPLLLWAFWNWFGAAALTVALPSVHLGQLDFWAALGITTVAGVLTTPTNSSKD